MEELSEPVVVREGERPKRVSKQRALLKSLFARAIKGDSRAAAKLVDLMVKLHGLEDPAASEPVQPLSVEEREVLEHLKAWIAEATGIPLPVVRHSER